MAVYWTTEAADVFVFEDDGLWGVGFVVLVILIGLYFSDLYESYRIPSRIALFQQFCVVLGAAFLFQSVLNYGRWSTLVLPRRSMVYGSALALVILPLWRIAFSSLVWKGIGARRLLFLGSSPLVIDIVERIVEHPELGLAVIGFLDNGLDASGQLSGAPRLGAVADLEEVVKAQQPDSIVVGMTERRQKLPVQQLLELRLSGIHVEEAANTYQTIFHRVSTRDLRPSQLIFSSELGPSSRSIALQTVYSLVICLIALVPALPVMIVVALLVKLTSPGGPVLFRQTRVGFNETPFTLYKFRSMFANAEADTGPVWAVKDDPRITPLGRWLRRLRLDELPQLLNVLRGEMAICGPRPERPEFVSVLEEKIPYYRQRHCVKPGITGWAQINHKYGDTIEDTIIKLEFDLYYIKNLSWSLDAYIMFHTAKTMLSARGSQ